MNADARLQIGPGLSGQARASGRVAGNVAGTCNVNVSPGRRLMPQAWAVRPPSPSAQWRAYGRLLSRAGAGWVWAVGRLRVGPRALRAPPCFSRVEAKTTRHPASHPRGRPPRVYGCRGSWRQATRRRLQVRFGRAGRIRPAPPSRGANSSRIIPFRFSWAVASRGQRSPGKNATGPFRLRPARTLQGETRYARYRYGDVRGVACG